MSTGATPAADEVNQMVFTKPRLGFAPLTAKIQCRLKLFSVVTYMGPYSRPANEVLDHKSFFSFREGSNKTLLLGL